MAIWVGSGKIHHDITEVVSQMLFVGTFENMKNS
jgi:hypothetical protein